MRVVLAEKPSVAKDIARVLGADKKGDGFLEGNGWCVTWAYGHLVQLADPAAYDENYSKWSIESLPILPDKFIYNVSGDGSAKRQFKVISRLFSEADDIVCATDAGREGEAIFRYIYNMSKCTKPFKRLWISSLTDKAIKDGFAALRPGGEYDNLYLSAKARNEADWIVGLNATRALTIASESRTPLSLGRVQTPTLSLVVARYLANRNFTPSKFYTAEVSLSAHGSRFTAECRDRFEKKGDAVQALTSSSDKAVVMNKKMQLKTEKAPLPFDITSLQAEANRRYGFGAQKTLDLVQKLYEEHKMLTYPRTGSRYLGDDMVEEVVKNIPLLAGLSMPPAFREALRSLEGGINKACFDSSKLTDHHAIIPTFHNIDKRKTLSTDEGRIYDLVAVQLVMALMQPCEKSCLSYTFDIGGGKCFEASGFVIVTEGWRSLHEQRKGGDVQKEEGEDEEQKNQLLPDLDKGEEVDITDRQVKEGMTKKPPLLTEATLLKSMETAGKLVGDEDLSKAMKDCGLGTPATRAAIIETLYKRGYMVSSAGRLAPTEIGMRIYHMARESAIGDVSMTGEWEYKLNQIAEGRQDASEFMRGIRNFVAKEVQRLVEGGKACRINELEELTCPLCGSALVQNSKAFGCSRYKDGCKFVVWKKMAGKEIGLQHLKEILEKGSTTVMKGFVNKEGKEFEASLKWSPEEEKIVYDFPKQKKIGGDAGLTCPVCGKAMNENARGVYCTDKDCGFVVWKKMAGKELPASVIESLVKKGETGVIRGFRSKEGRKFDAKLVIEDGEVVFNFNFPKAKK